MRLRFAVRGTGDSSLRIRYGRNRDPEVAQGRNMLVEALDEGPERSVGGGTDYVEGEVSQGRVRMGGEGCGRHDAKGAAPASSEGPEEFGILVGVCGYVGSLGASRTCSSCEKGGRGRGGIYICRDDGVLQNMIRR